MGRRAGVGAALLSWDGGGARSRELCGTRPWWAVSPAQAECPTDPVAEPSPLLCVPAAANIWLRQLAKSMRRGIRRAAAVPTLQPFPAAPVSAGLSRPSPTPGSAAAVLPVPPALPRGHSAARAQCVEGPCLCSGEPWCQHVALEGCWLPLPRCRAGWLLVLPHCASSVPWLQPPDPPLTTCTSPSLCATLGAPHSGPGWGLCWCSPAPLTPLCYGLSPASFNLSHRGCLRSSPPRGVARKAGLHGWGWAHRDGAALLSPWHCLRSQGCSWCVLGVRGHGPCMCAGHAATQWQGASQGVPPPVPTALPVLLQSPRAVCRGVLGGADRLLPLEMWLWFTGELRSQPKGSESGVTAQLLPTEVCISASGAHGVGKPCPRPGSAVPAAIERRW